MCSTTPADGVVVMAFQQEDANKPDQIYICPWFLSWWWIQVVRPQLHSSVQPPAWIVNVPQKFSEALAASMTTPFDSYRLLAKVILHEITHTKTAGASIDTTREGVHTLGWRRSIQMARPDGHMVAESLAVVGIGGAVIDAGYTLNEDGSWD